MSNGAMVGRVTGSNSNGACLQDICTVVSHNLIGQTTIIHCLLTDFHKIGTVRQVHKLEKAGLF